MKISRSNKPTLVQANDIFCKILLPLQERAHGEQGAYFYRLIGFDDQAEFLKKVALLHQQLTKLGDLYLYFSSNIPIPFNKILTDKIAQALADLKSTQPRVICDCLDQAKLFPAANNQIKNNLQTILELYIKNEPEANQGMVKNFVSKIMLWTYRYISSLEQNNTNWNPKVLYYGDIKKHSVYFLILLSQMGCDVLYINPHSDAAYQRVDRSDRFSQRVEGRIKTKLAECPIKAAPELASKPVISGHGAVIKLKKCTNIWQDILLPLHKRSGYLGSPPILPIYFYRHIGLQDTSSVAIDEYYNTLYQLAKTLTNRACGFVHLIDQVPMPNNTDIDNYKVKLQQSDGQDLLINRMVQANILPTTNNKLLNNTIKMAFQETMALFINQGSNNHPAKLENFALKLIGWINMYFKALYTSSTFQDSPKVLYYGNIKQHEVYLLIYFSKIGCDVLYVNTEHQKDDIFKEIDPAEQHTKLIEQPNSATLEPFPSVERAVRKATVAYHAAQEIQQMIYSEDTGLFKPWQFEEYQTQPVTLRTTYDELKILWSEEARIRPEFKVVNGTVYVPNLFAKVSGTHEDISLYWQDYKLLTGAPNTHVITQVPFTKINYSKRDLYASAFLFNSDGLLNKEKLMQSNFYQLAYLRNSLQDFIINKIQELIKINPFIGATDKELPLKILMTVLTMDEKILRLMETFDYPKTVPKLVIYDSTKEVFSTEDAIMIAFLNIVGLDVAIFTPTNYKNIELKLQAELLDEHQLPALHLDLVIPDLTAMPTEPGRIGNLFNQLSAKIRRKFC